MPQAPQDEDLDEGEDHRPEFFGDPLRDKEGGDQQMQEEEAVAGLSVGEREGDPRYLERLVELDHAVGGLVEDAGQQRRRDGEDPRLDVLDDELLHPLVDQLHLGVRILEGLQRLPVDGVHVEQLELERLDVRDLVAVAVLYLRERHRVQHAKQARDAVLEVAGAFGRRLRVLAEAYHRAARVEPLRPHPHHRCGPVPEPRVGLRRAEDDEERDQHVEPAPDRGVLEDVRVVEREVEALVHEELQHQRRDGARERRRER
mmetsp:Transcript_110828/g.313605  ORF Transcript_110828/g.313605 Transcript_110828/m.313605 type:complete len:259 (+) Transcript_110828:601-1377(+)